MDRVAAQLAFELLGRPLGHDLAAVDDRDPLGELVGLLEVVGGQEDRLAALGRQPRDLRPYVRADLGIEPGGRLVEEQHRGVVDERHRDVETALHAAAVAPSDPVGGVGQPEPVEQLLARALGRGGRRIPWI